MASGVPTGMAKSAQGMFGRLDPAVWFVERSPKCGMHAHEHPLQIPHPPRDQDLSHPPGESCGGFFLESPTHAL